MVLLAVLAVLLQTLLPLAHRPPVGGNAWAASHFCLSSPDIAMDGTPAADPDRPTPPTERKAPPCIVCQALQQLGACVLPAAAPAAGSPTGEAERTVVFALAAVPADPPVSPAQPRAPPAA